MTMAMVVENIGYLKLNSVLELEEHFSIYETHKKTQILVKNTSDENLTLYSPDKSRVNFKIVENKKICNCKKVFDSETDSKINIDTTKWNNGSQIMSYKEYCYK